MIGTNPQVFVPDDPKEEKFDPTLDPSTPLYPATTTTPKVAAASTSVLTETLPIWLKGGMYAKVEEGGGGDAEAAKNAASYAAKLEAMKNMGKDYDEELVMNMVYCSQVRGLCLTVLWLSVHLFLPLFVVV